MRSRNDPGEPTPAEVARLVLYNPDFTGKSLERLRTHAIFGPAVERFLLEGRTDYRRLRAQLRLIQATAKRKRKWISAFTETHDEVEACEKSKTLYQTFCRWRNQDVEFKSTYEAIRELRGRALVDVARRNAETDEGTMDRWNLIKTEVPEYSPKKQVASVNVSFNGDIDFRPKGNMPRAGVTETTADES